MVGMTVGVLNNNINISLQDYTIPEACNKTENFKIQATCICMLSIDLDPSCFDHQAGLCGYSNIF